MRRKLRRLRELLQKSEAEQMPVEREQTNKLIHAPTSGLRRAAENGRFDVLDVANDLLGIREEAEVSEHPPEVHEADDGEGHRLELAIARFRRTEFRRR